MFRVGEGVVSPFGMLVGWLDLLLVDGLLLLEHIFRSLHLLLVEILYPIALRLGDL